MGIEQNTSTRTHVQYVQYVHSKKKKKRRKIVHTCTFVYTIHICADIVGKPHFYFLNFAK